MRNEKLYNAGWKSEFLSGPDAPIMGFVGNLGYVVVCILGASMAAGGSMTIGGIQAFIQYLRSFTQPITQMASISSQVQRTMAAAERIFNFLDEPEIVEKHRNTPWKTAISAATSALTMFASVTKTPRDCHPRFLRRCESGPEDRYCRPDGCRQNDYGKASHALP